MHYRDFIISLNPLTDSQFELELATQDGPLIEQVDLPFKVRELLSKLDRLIDKHPDRKLCGPEVKARKREIGTMLFETFFQGEIGRCFKTIRTGRDGIRIKLHIQPSNNHSHPHYLIPWELMIQPGDPHPLCLAPDISFVRHLPTGQFRNQDMPRPFPEVLRILVLTSNPEEHKSLAVELDEKAFFDLVTRSFKGNETVEFQMLASPTLGKLQSEMARFKPHILHVNAHGHIFSDSGTNGPKNPTDELGFMLFDKAEQEHRSFLGASALSGVLMQHLDHLRMVTLVSCRLGRMIHTEDHIGFAAALCRDGVPVVVAFQFELFLTAANSFIDSFYSSIADGKRIGSAMAAARGGIYGELANGREIDMEYGSPVLYSNLPDGRLFRRKQVVHVVSRDEKLIHISDEDVDVVNLAEYFEGNGLKSPRLIEDVTWNGTIFDKLTRIKRCVTETLPLQFEGQMHISIMTALGYIFNETCQFETSYLQKNRFDNSVETWRSNIRPKRCEMESEFEKSSEASKDLIACVSISNESKQDVLEYFQMEDKPYHAMLHLFPKTGISRSAIPDHGSALYLARLMGEEVKRVAKRLRARRVHLFVTSPLGFALFLGMQLNACPEIQLYEYANPGYLPSIVLGGVRPKQ